MLRELITNRWILGIISFLILFSVSCYLWYRYEVAPYCQQSDETIALVRQINVFQGTDKMADSSTEEVSEETTPISETSITENNESVSKKINTGSAKSDISEINRISTEYANGVKQYAIRV